MRIMHVNSQLLGLSGLSAADSASSPLRSRGPAPAHTTSRSRSRFAPAQSIFGPVPLHFPLRSHALVLGGPVMHV